jgi:polyphosphate kinase
MMKRNLLRRVETCFPVTSSKLRQRVIDDLNLYLSDNSQAWILSDSGRYERVTREEDAEVISAQSTLLAQMEKAY